MMTQSLWPGVRLLFVSQPSPMSFPVILFGKAYSSMLERDELLTSSRKQQVWPYAKMLIWNSYDATTREYMRQIHRVVKALWKDSANQAVCSKASLTLGSWAHSLREKDSLLQYLHQDTYLISRSYKFLSFRSWKSDESSGQEEPSVELPSTKDKGYLPCAIVNINEYYNIPVNCQRTVACHWHPARRIRKPPELHSLLVDQFSDGTEIRFMTEAITIEMGCINVEAWNDASRSKLDYAPVCV